MGDWKETLWRRAPVFVHSKSLSTVISVCRREIEETSFASDESRDDNPMEIQTQFSDEPSALAVDMPADPKRLILRMTQQLVVRILKDLKSKSCLLMKFDLARSVGLNTIGD